MSERAYTAVELAMVTGIRHSEAVAILADMDNRRTPDEWIERIDREKLAEMLKPYFNGGDVAYGEHVECAEAVLAALPELMGGAA